MKNNQRLTLKKQNTIYDANNWLIFKKNFLAGFSHSAGAWFFNIIVLSILAYILIPIFGPFFKSLSERMPKNLNDIVIQIEKNND